MCMYPITAYRTSNYEIVFKKPKDVVEELQLPCGKCQICRINKANDWATRCWAEKNNWQNNCFITLTYNEENLPKNKYLQKDDMTKFWKRLRYYHEGKESWEYKNKISNPIRYMYCGEYGDKTQRPHYHALVFNWMPEDLEKFFQNHRGEWLYKSKELEKIWDKGYVIIGELTYQSACYVARYTMKKISQNKKTSLKKINEITKDKLGIEIYDEERPEEFIETSRNGGIGIKYWNDNKEKIKENSGILIKQKKVIRKQIPKFFLNKWKKEDEIEYEFWKYEQDKIKEEKWNKILKETDLNKKEYQTMINNKILDKIKLLKRKTVE